MYDMYGRCGFGASRRVHGEYPKEGLVGFPKWGAGRVPQTGFWQSVNYECSASLQNQGLGLRRVAVLPYPKATPADICGMRAPMGAARVASGWVHGGALAGCKSTLCVC